MVDPERLTIVNSTMPDHLLHPGNVFRKIVRDGDDLYVVTQGYGTGILPRANEVGSHHLWSRVDDEIFKELNPPQFDYPMDEMNAVAGTGAAEEPYIPPAVDRRPELRTPPPIFFSPR